jgi:replicative superfamily II helicase
MSSLSTSRRFDAVYREILAQDTRRQLSPILKPEPIAHEDIWYALSVASRLALFGDGHEPERARAARTAYEVAVRSLGFANGDAQAIRSVADLVLSRIGNFPAKQLLKEKQGEAPVFDPFLGVEILAREFENRLPDSPQNTVLTDFQVRLVRSFEANRAVSVSAPTSAGKSFTLEIELLRRLQAEAAYTAIFVVPTRALIRQVTFDLVRLLRENDLTDVNIQSSPSPGGDPEAPQKRIYVLTQERLATLISANPTILNLDALIVDEAHEIAEANRGLTLERVLLMTLARFPLARVFFSSPLRSNPEYLLSLFGASDKSEHFVEHLSPVTQNIILITPVKGRGNTDSAKFELALEDERIDLGTAKLPFEFRGVYLGKLAYHLTSQSDTAIIYCNGPSAAEKVAMEIAAEIEVPFDDDELRDLAGFLKQEVHARYSLAAVVVKGIAFHYGNIPQIIRGRLEDLLRERKIRFVCCTSTLLQGVNLPAKNIFVENPQKGRGRTMEKGDFWNLVGRAGRLSKEFSGNVFCVFGRPWEADVLGQARLSEISSAYQLNVKERTGELLSAVEALPDSSEGGQMWAEQTFSRIFAEFVSSGKLMSDTSPGAVNENVIAIDRLTRKIHAERTLPDELYTNNLYLHPARLDALANYFRNLTNLGSAVPLFPTSEGAFDRLVEIFQSIETLMIRANNRSFRYFAFLANKWMAGATLKELVENKLIYKKIDDDADKINEAIRELFDELELALRYRYVKYTKIYIDVLKAVFLERSRADDAEKVLPLHLFLEYGASSETLINLISLGLSRTSALLLRPRIARDLDVAACQRFIDRINLDLTDLPAVCKAEIFRLRRVNAG